jgi:16S rRNA (cytosine1402-N4)-methyltransferase
MDTRDGLTAADILNQYRPQELQRVFGDLGEVRNAKTLAEAVVKAREIDPFRNTVALVDLCEKYFLGDRMRYRSQVFQSLRMEVNDELGALEEFLQSAFEMLAPGGILAVIAFHSLEDRMVKNFLKTGNFTGEMKKDFYGNIERPWELITKKAIEPSAAEVTKNIRSRSSKLRIGKKI